MLLQMNVTPPVSMPQPSVKPFIPATPPTLRNVEQYQPPSLGSHLYPVCIFIRYTFMI